MILENENTMDKLVAQYTHSPHQDEFYSEREQQELTECLPPISLKFNLPPLDNVSPVYFYMDCAVAAGFRWVGGVTDGRAASTANDR